MWDEITYPFPNFNGATVEVWEWDKQFHPTFYNGCNYVAMVGLKLSYVSLKGVPVCVGQDVGQFCNLKQTQKGYAYFKSHIVYLPDRQAVRSPFEFCPEAWNMKHLLCSY